MFGAEFSELILFLKQFFLVAAGASALWGLYLQFRGRKKGESDISSIIYQNLSRNLFYLFSFFLILALMTWILPGFFDTTWAHEGITFVSKSIQESTFVKNLKLVGFSLMTLFTIIFIYLRLYRAKTFNKYLEYFFASVLVLSTAIISFPEWTGSFSREQLFVIGHNLHSIFTIGTVIVLDFMYLRSKFKNILKEHLLPIFPTMSKVIWIGLAIEFSSVFLILEDAIAFTPKFFFMQTVVGIIIINGVILTGPISRWMLDTVKDKGKRLSRKQVLYADISGTLSITSWFSITFVDFFKNLTLNYGHFLGIYLSLLIILFIGHRIWEFFDQGPEVIPIH